MRTLRTMSIPVKRPAALLLAAACGGEREAALPSGSRIPAPGCGLEKILAMVRPHGAKAVLLSVPALKGDPLPPNAAGHAPLSGKIFDALESIGYAY